MNKVNEKLREAFFSYRPYMILALSVRCFALFDVVIHRK